MKLSPKHYFIGGGIVILLLVLVRLYFMFFVGGMFQQMPMGPVPVTATKISYIKTKIWKEFSGRIVAVDKVDIMPRVAGEITKILFKDGDFVKKGQALFTIDTRAYDAELKRAQSVYSGALKDYNRADILIKARGISQKEFDEKVTALKSAQASFNIAKLNMEYANVIAPISGKIGRAEVTLGNLVSPQVGQVLATIVANDKVYAEFDVDEQTYVRFISAEKNSANLNEPDVKVENIDGAEIVSRQEKVIPVQLALAGESEPSETGVLVAFDNKLNPDTGTIRARAIFENIDGRLISGLYAKVFLGSAEDKELILLNDLAVGTDQDKRFVYVVNKDNKVEYRQVKIGDSSNGKRIIEEGLNEGDIVVVSGVQKIRPDAEVKATIE